MAFASCLKREKDRYQMEKNARYALIKRDSDEEEYVGVNDKLLLRNEQDEVNSDSSHKLIRGQRTSQT